VNRLARASPVAFEPRAGKFAAVDTPPETPPDISNPEDLTARLAGLFQSLAMTLSQVESGEYNTPLDLARCLRELLSLKDLSPLSWYVLDDSRCALVDCMTNHDGRESWNETLVGRLDRISRRVDEIEPLLRPRQLSPSESGAKPVLPDPVLIGSDEAHFQELASELSSVLASPDADKVLDFTGRDAFERELKHAQEGLSSSETAVLSGDVRASRRRRGLRGLAMVIGSFVFAVGSGTTVSLLTAPDAALTFAARLRPLLDAILKFFT
jgi:hypothetical protein